MTKDTAMMEEAKRVSARRRADLCRIAMIQYIQRLARGEARP